MKPRWIYRFAFTLLLVARPAAAQDMPLTQVLPPGEGWRLLETSLASIGGLTADAKGQLYVSDPERKQILRVSLDGKAEVWAKTSAAVHGLAVDRVGLVYGCQPAEGQIVRFDADGKETTVAEKLPGVRHLVATRNGAIYCARPAHGLVQRVEKNGAARIVDQGILSPSGLTLWSDEGTLVVAESGDGYLWALRVDKDGSLSCKERYYPLRVPPKEASKAGGLALDEKGRIYAATRNGVHVFDPTGRLCGVLLHPGQGNETALAFAGPERNMLVLACGNKLYVRKTLAKGIR